MRVVSLPIAISLVVLSVIVCAADDTIFYLPPNVENLPLAGPDSYCRRPDVVANIIMGLSETSAVKNAGETVVDFVNSSTVSVNVAQKSFSCHGVINLSNGQMISGTFAALMNAAGNSIWRWMNDPSEAPPSDASVFYESRYKLTGLLLRSSKVCGDDWKRTIDAAFGLVSSPEFVAMSKGYPQTTAQWMGEGADNFNRGVMTDGIEAACAYAETVRAKAEAISRFVH